MARGGDHILPAVEWSRWEHALRDASLFGGSHLCSAWLWTAPHAWGPMHRPLGRDWDPSHASGFGSGMGTAGGHRSWADSCCPGTGSRSFSYSPVLAFMVAGTLCWEVMTAEIPTPYSVPGTRSIGRCRNQRYSVCASGREDGGAGSE